MLKFKELNRDKKSLEIIFHLSKKVCNLNQYINHREKEVDFCLLKFQEALHSSRPLSHTSGFTFFKNRKFFATPDVFTPRWESETLIPTKKTFHSILEICSGSGALGISCALENRYRYLTLVDICPKATELSEKNLQLHQVTGEAFRSDWSVFLQGKSFDLIIANFPYVEKDDYLEEGVEKWEPHLALFGGWTHYQKLLDMMVNSNFQWKQIILEINPTHYYRFQKLNIPDVLWEAISDEGKILGLKIINLKTACGTLERSESA